MLPKRFLVVNNMHAHTICVCLIAQYLHQWGPKQAHKPTNTNFTFDDTQIWFQANTPSQYDFANLNLPSGSTTGSPFITASNYVMDFESYSSTDTSGVPVWEVPAAGDITTAGGDISVACACSVTSDQATCTISAFDTITGKIKWSIALADQSVVDAGVSPDGTTVTLLTVFALPPYPSSNFTTLVTDFDAVSGAQLGSWTGPEGMQGRALVVTDSLFAIVDTSVRVVQPVKADCCRGILASHRGPT